MRLPRLLLTAALATSALAVSGAGKVSVHGSVQAGVLFPQKDASIGATDDYDSPILFNTYADVGLPANMWMPA